MSRLRKFPFVKRDANSRVGRRCERKRSVEHLEQRDLLAAVPLEFSVVVGNAAVATFDPWSSIGGFSQYVSRRSESHLEQFTEVPSLPNDEPTELMFRAVAVANGRFSFDDVTVGDQISIAIGRVDLSASPLELSIVTPTGEKLPIEFEHHATTLFVPAFVVDQPGDYVLRFSTPLDVPLTAFRNVSYENVTSANDSMENATALRLDPSDLDGVTIAGEAEVIQYSPLDEVLENGPVPETWQTSISHPAAGVFVESGVDGKSIILQTAEDPNGRKLEPGPILYYDSESGNVQVEARPRGLTTLEIGSRSGRFTGNPLPIFDENPFNVFSPQKLFVLTMDANFTLNPLVETIDFGSILPNGLTYDQLSRDLVFSGSYAPGGTLNPVSIVVDGDESSLVELRGTSRVELSIPTHDLSRLTFRYEWSELNGRDPRDASISHALRVVGPNETEGVRPIELRGCGWSVCEENFWLEPGAERIVLESIAADTRLEIHELKMEGGTTDWFEIVVSPNQTIELTTTSFRHESSIYDSDGERITNQVHRVKLTADGRPESYYLALRGPDSRESASADFSYVASLTNSTRDAGESHDFRANASEFHVGVQFTQVVDQRTCALEDFVWDGPPLEGIDFYGQHAYLTPAEPISEGHYQLSIAPESCLDLLGRSLRRTTSSIDFVPPKLVDVSLETLPWLPPGDGLLVLQYDEPVNAFPFPSSDWGAVFLESPEIRINLFDDAIEDRSSPKVLHDGNRVFLKLGNLTTGNHRVYTVAEGYSGIQDLNGNIAAPLVFDIPFIVSESLPPELGSFEPFDLDHSGIVDDNDLSLLESVAAIIRDQPSWSSTQGDERVSNQSPNVDSDVDLPKPQYDLNRDGQVNSMDIELLATNGLGLQIGDTNRDGRFDAADLAMLADIAYGTPAGWRSGDYDGDGYFTESDLTYLFQAAEFDRVL